jgi:hypothetical protein
MFVPFVIPNEAGNPALETKDSRDSSRLRQLTDSSERSVN